MSQPRQSDGHLLLIAGAYAISDDINLMPRSEKIERSLGDADVAFDADDNAGERTGGVERVERLFDFWCSIKGQQGEMMHTSCCSLHHREQRLVKMTDCLDAIGLIQFQLRTCLAQSRSVLGCCEYGNVQ